ncbi:hypothetical protein KWF73_18315 [Acinetobacter pittii]|uniref:hypothetical protein n=1 Tax=Acinetobacter pittii TaxID=48296 RepID=UPI00355BE5DB
MKVNFFNISVLFFITLVLTGCAQEVGERYVEVSWPFLKYGWLVMLSLGLVTKFVGFTQVSLNFFAMAFWGLIVWGVYYFMACPELCRLIQ